MLPDKILSLMRCTHCHAHELRRRVCVNDALECMACATRFLIQGGIPDMVPPNGPRPPDPYRTEALLNLIAGVYHYGAPALSLGLWRCPPLRWVDSENRALGRANGGGVYLRAPISTGLVLDRVVADYHDVVLLGVDRSWNMLAQAKKRLAKLDRPVYLFHADYDNLPFRPGVIDSLQSFNGLHAFTDRASVLADFRRCLKEGGFISGSALVRGQETIADMTLDRLEQSGVYPLLRAPEFLLHDLEEAKLEDLHYEVHGAVMFYSAQADSSDQFSSPVSA